MLGDAVVLDDYCRRGWPLFPCRRDNKGPLVERGFYAATTDKAIITQWRERWPNALIGSPTGRGGAGWVVLDIDIKKPTENGLDTLAELGHAILPDTPIVHTASGGLHVYFDPGDREIRNTAGKRGRGIGPGLDIRGNGGYVIVPTPGSGYYWDPVANFDLVVLARLPDWLIPAEPEYRRAGSRPVRPSPGLSPYAEAALDSACRRIIAAPNGEQEASIHGEAFAIGTLAAVGGIPADFARGMLLWAARRILDYDPRRPWRQEVERKVDRSFERGLQHRREVRHG
jgi:hypothetical protein